MFKQKIPFIRIFFRLCSTFLVLALLIYYLPLQAIAASTKAKEDEKEYEPKRVSLSPWKLKQIINPDIDQRQLNPEEAGKFISDRMANPTSDATNEIIKKFSFAALAGLARNGMISPEHSLALAEQRSSMIKETFGEVIKDFKAIHPNATLTIGILDSGNKVSGIASDVDQTIFIFPKDLASKIKLTEAKVIKAFNDKFKNKFGFTPDRLGIETMDGDKFFPDWRQSHSITDMVIKSRMVSEAKRKVAGAYISEGGVTSQGAGRGYESLRQQRKMVRILAETKTRIEAQIANAEKNPKLTDAEKVTRIKKFREKIGSLEEKARRLSPWTEITWDENNNKPSSSSLEDPRKKAFANKPELSKRFAFDGAWDNKVMFDVHPEDRPKFLLRGVSEGASLTRKVPKGKTLTTFEYEKHFKNDKAACRTFIDDVYRDLPEGTRDKFQKALDVASKARLKHKGADYTNEQVWKEYIDEAKTKFDPKNVLPAHMHQEMAQRLWENDAREIMLENLLRTSKSTAEHLNTPLTDEDFKKIKVEFPQATKAKLKTAIELQLFQGFYELMTKEHARALATSDADKRKALNDSRHTDLVDRILKKIRSGGDKKLIKRVEELAKQAAIERMALEIGEQKWRDKAFYNFVLDSVKTRMNAASDFGTRIKENYESGKYTKEYVIKKMYSSVAGRLMGASAQVLGSMGLQGEIRVWESVTEENKLPTFDIEWGKPAFSSKKLMSNMASAANFDSLLQVTRAYQVGGASEAAWVAARELVMNVPGVGPGYAVYELVAHGKPRGVVMLGSAMLIPGMGQIFILVSISTTSVMIVGDAIMTPLNNDLADRTYQGYLGKESGYKETELSRRTSILDPVKFHVIPVKIVDDEGRKRTKFLVKEYTDEEALELYFREPGEDTQWMREQNLLGGGKEFDAELSKIKDWINHPKENFEAKRASLFYHYEKRVLKYLDEQNIVNMLDENEVIPALTKLFRQNVDDWIFGRREYAHLVGGENALLQSRLTPELRDKIAFRMAGDYYRSWQIMREDEHSIEKGMKKRIDDARNKKIAFESNAYLQAQKDAREQELKRYMITPEMADKMHAVIAEHKEEASIDAPRIHVWPRVQNKSDELLGIESYEYKNSIGKNEEENSIYDLEGDRIECMLSVVANPETYPPPYSFKYKWLITNELEGELLSVEVKAFDKNDRMVGESVTKQIGYLEEDAKPIGMTSSNIMVRTSKKSEKEKKDATEKSDVEMLLLSGDKFDFFWEPLSSSKLTPFDNGGGPEKSPYGRLGSGPHLWVRWKEAPSNQSIFIKGKIHGGTPPFEKEFSYIGNGQKEFDPPEKPYPPEKGNAFVINFPYPSGHAGTFTVEGKIQAFENGWRGSKPPDNLVPSSELSFSDSFSITNNFARKAEGSASYSEKVLKGKFHIDNCQTGKRLAEIKAGGKSSFIMVNASMYNGLSASFEVYGAKPENNMTVTFRDFGSDISIDVPLKIKTYPDYPTSRKEIDRLIKKLNNELKIKPLHPQNVAYRYKNLANAYSFRNHPHDLKNWKKNNLKMLEYMEQFLEIVQKPNWKGYNHFRNVRINGKMINMHIANEKDSSIKKQAINYIVNQKRYDLFNEYTRIALMAFNADDIESGKAWLEKAQEHAKELIKDEYRTVDVYYSLAQVYNRMAETTVQVRGDIEGARSHWIKSQKYRAKRNKKDTAIDFKNYPWEIDEDFSRCK
jgi:hypothetical protein